MLDIIAREARAAELKSLEGLLASTQTARKDPIFKDYWEVMRGEVMRIEARVLELRTIAGLEDDLTLALASLGAVAERLAEYHSLDKSAPHYNEEACKGCDVLNMAEALLGRFPDVADPGVYLAGPDLKAALLGLLNPTGHTDSCTERRAIGETKCSRKCAAARVALTKAGVDFTETDAKYAPSPDSTNQTGETS